MRPSRLAFLLVLAFPLPSPGQEASGPRLWSTATVVGQTTRADGIRSELAASLDVFFELQAGPALFHLYVESSTTPRSGGVSSVIPFANMDAGTALDGDGSGRIQISELRAALPVRDRTTLHAGLMDLTGFLDVSRIANDERLFFLAQPFVNNPTIVFPDYTLGTVLLVGLPNLPGGELALAVSSSRGLAELPDASHATLFDLDGSDRGTFLAGRFEWEGERFHGSVGVWHSTGERLETLGRDRPLPDGGVYTVLGWSSRPSSLDLRLGQASGNGLNEPFVGITYLGEIGANALGFGLARAPALPEAVDRLGTHAEVFLRRNLTGILYLTTSAQWLSREFLPLEAAGDGAWIFGFRASATF